MGTNNSTFWKVVKDEKEQKIISLSKSNGTQTSSQDETLKRVAEYFNELHKKKDINRQGVNPSTQRTMGDTGSLVKEIKIKEVTVAINSLKNGKAAGPDKIPNEFIKKGSKHLKSHLCNLFNGILTKGVTPTQWGEGLTHIIYKDKGDITDLTNYRGITVNNAFYKVFTYILNKRLTTLAEKSGILG